MTPRSRALRLEQRRVLPHAIGECFGGYGLMGLAFESGDVLAMRRVTASSVGPPYIAVWHRDPRGDWVFYTNIDPVRACPRYFGPALHDARTDDLGIRWPGPYEVVISARRARLQLALRLRTRGVTRLVSGASRLVPRPAWAVPSIARGLGRGAAALLDVGNIALHGTTPSGHHFTLRPDALWHVAAAAAVLGGRDLGGCVRLQEPLMLGDFQIPSRGLFVTGSTVFRLPASAEGADVTTQRTERDELIARIIRHGGATDAIPQGERPC
jgi:hypothetical protein